MKIEHIEVCAGYLVSFERRQGLQQAVVHPLPGGGGAPPPGTLGEGQPIGFEEPAYELACGGQVCGVQGCVCGGVHVHAYVHSEPSHARSRAQPNHPPIHPPLLHPPPPPTHTQGDFDSSVLRFHFCSLRTPDQTIDYDMATGRR